MKFFSTLLLFAVFAFVLGGCSDDSNPAGTGGTPTTTSYVGVFAGPGASGSISIKIPAAKRAFATDAVAGDTLAITGTMKINGGATVPLTGHHIISTGEIYLEGGGYVFTGAVDAGTIAGTFTYQGGTGSFSCKQGNASDVRTYCGRFQDYAPGTETGYFNMTINAASVVVLVSPDGQAGSGFVTTGVLGTQNQIMIYHPENGQIVIATGTLNPATGVVSGVYAGNPGGTWSGSPCN